MRHVSILNKTRANVLGEQIAVADTFATRFLGLMGKRSLAPRSGLLIAPSSGVHTCWMRMAIDVVALDRDNRIVGIGHSVKPWRIHGLTRKTKSVLELPAGQILACSARIGDQLAIEH